MKEDKMMFYGFISLFQLPSRNTEISTSQPNMQLRMCYLLLEVAIIEKRPLSVPPGVLFRLILGHMRHAYTMPPPLGGGVNLN